MGTAGREATLDYAIGGGLQRPERFFPSFSHQISPAFEFPAAFSSAFGPFCLLPALAMASNSGNTSLDAFRDHNYTENQLHRQISLI